MLNTNGFKIILASGSPRRKAFFEQMELPFKVKVIPVDEDFPSGLNGIEIAKHIVHQKADAFISNVKEKQLIITADTIVWHNNESLGKPKNNVQAKNMLMTLSNDSHEVITAVGFLQKDSWELIYEVSRVTFGKINDLEIELKRDERVIRWQTVRLDKFALEYAERRKKKLSVKTKEN